MAKSDQLRWLSISLSSYDSDECLLWPFRVDRDGYGRVYLNGKKVGAHRLAYQLIHGRWPEPCCLHRCDNPTCVNPRHLFEGSDLDNHADQVKKGRQTRGEQQHDAKLTEEAVISARAEYAEGQIGFGLLAKKYGVSKIVMRWAVTGIRWSHIPGAVDPFLSRPAKNHCGKGHLLNNENVYSYPNGKRYCKQCTADRAKKRRK